MWGSVDGGSRRRLRVRFPLLLFRELSATHGYDKEEVTGGEKRELLARRKQPLPVRAKKSRWCLAACSPPLDTPFPTCDSSPVETEKAACTRTEAYASFSDALCSPSSFPDSFLPATLSPSVLSCAVSTDFFPCPSVSLRPPRGGRVISLLSQKRFGGKHRRSRLLWLFVDPSFLRFDGQADSESCSAQRKDEGRFSGDPLSGSQSVEVGRARKGSTAKENIRTGVSSSPLGLCSVSPLNCPSFVPSLCVLFDFAAPVYFSLASAGVRRWSESLQPTVVRWIRASGASLQVSGASHCLLESLLSRQSVASSRHSIPRRIFSRLVSRTPSSLRRPFSASAHARSRLDARERPPCFCLSSTPDRFSLLSALPRDTLCLFFVSSHLLKMASDGDVDTNIEQWKIKRLIKNLESARGNGTSMISLIIKPKDEITRINKMLADEFGTASNIKSRVNRLSVLSAITSTQQRLKLYNKTPPNGLVVYCGTIITDDGKEKKVSIDFEPFKAVNTSLYLCDNKFHVEALAELLESDAKFGFIVLDGNGALFATLQGSTKEVLHRFTVDLPKKHGRGGQSAMRFARLRLEKRHNYVRKVAETAVQMFITQDKVNVSGLILAGSADFKNDLATSGMFDQRLQAKVIKIVDVSYGGDNGFNQAIELSAEALTNVKFIQEKKLIGRFFDEVAQDTGKYVFGVQETLQALEMGAVELLIVFEGLPLERVTLKNPVTNAEKVIHITPDQARDDSLFKEDGVELEVADKISFSEWLVNNYKNFGTTLDFVTNRSQEGAQFERGFGGLGGILRYKVDFQDYDETVDDEDEFI
ncbi:putative eukaryotic peptide chain release factor [Toxoplasma gondii MAS]|uniref:Eukaryotic peptide chain release factor subunit 1 n=1 Tax=Toxoplasma gondii MAS TaxID=943118 RepID=A0A086Q615_TOXGO|nr:putative eukaryotic peptide chain release factor [Toxoplasma gondii MAS]